MPSTLKNKKTVQILKLKKANYCCFRFSTHELLFPSCFCAMMHGQLLSVILGGGEEHLGGKGLQEYRR